MVGTVRTSASAHPASTFSSSSSLLPAHAYTRGRLSGREDQKIRVEVNLYSSSDRHLRLISYLSFQFLDISLPLALFYFYLHLLLFPLSLLFFLSSFLVLFRRTEGSFREKANEERSLEAPPI